MVNVNWNNFKAKFNNHESAAFEQLAYNLFCEEFSIDLGIFRYKNQTGIETEPIVKDGQYIGFQAKFYDTGLASNKQDILDSISKSKGKNPNLNTLYIYTNQEFSESSSKTNKKPKYQLEIEGEAQKHGLSLGWRVSSHIERQLMLPKNKYLLEHFFLLGKSSVDYVTDLSIKTKRLFESINNEIRFNERSIKMDRTALFDNIDATLQSVSSLIVSGAGGCGKTAFIKDFYQSIHDSLPIYAFKATEFNVSSIEASLSPSKALSLSDFIAIHDKDKSKYVIIDSAEKLADLSNTDPFNEFLKELSFHNWKIIFTTRYGYLDDLKYRLSQVYDTPYNLIDISVLSESELKELSKQHGFSLPTEAKFLEMLTNLFYLNEYLQYYEDTKQVASYRTFRETIWNKRIIKREESYCDIHIQREKCFLEIASKRANSGAFYIDVDNSYSEALSKLRQDEIIGYDSQYSSYFITHDIYEEWALDRIIQREFVKNNSYSTFFENIGTSLPIRRAFRSWLSDRLYDDVSSVKGFIDESSNNDNIFSFWKDEIWVSILLSDHAELFFRQYEKDLAANEFALFIKILFLLRVACKEIDNSMTELLRRAKIDYVFTMPKGVGWQSAIKFIYNHKAELSSCQQDVIIPFLKEWVDKHKKGETTRFASLYALHLYQTNELRQDDKRYFSNEIEADIILIITSGANEIKSELDNVLQSIIDNKSILHSTPFYDLAESILKNSRDHIAVILLFPQKVIALCNLMWSKPEGIEDRFGRMEMEDHYSISHNLRHDCYPPSALQTPTYLLLEFAPLLTVDFIIEFINKSIDSFAQSQYGEDLEEVSLEVDGVKIKQWISSTIWQMYRGTGSMTSPYLLQSIHMALEKYLLNAAKSQDIEPILLKLLKESKSASLTSIVCSVVLAHPEKYYKIALILFGAYELFNYDNLRCSQESSAKHMYTLGSGLPNKENYSKERFATCEDKHRNSCLEFLCLKMQYEGVPGLPKEESEKIIQDIYGIIDSHKAYIDSIPPDNTLRLLVARIDRRNLTPALKETKEGNAVFELIPEIDPELKAETEIVTEKLMRPYRYGILRFWSNFLHETKKDERTKAEFEKYDSDPTISLEEVRSIIAELESEECSEPFYLANHSIPGYVCSKLMIEQREKMTKEEKDYCREIITSYVSSLFSDDYDYQIGDGVEAAVHALPALMKEYPEDNDKYILAILFILFNLQPLGHYKQICDYALETMAKSEMWNEQFDIAQSILSAFIVLKPIYNTSYKEARQSAQFGQRTSTKSVYEKFDAEVDRLIGNIDIKSLTFDIQDISNLSIYDIDIVMQMIPADTTNTIHKEIVKYLLPIILPQILCDRRESRKAGNSIEYGLSRRFLRKFAQFLLQREISEIDGFMQLSIEYLGATEETATFFDEIVSAEDELIQYDQFWRIWANIQPKYIELGRASKSYYFGKITHSYLLAWQWWRDGIEEWHSLKEPEVGFYSTIAKNVGSHPAVLYSISKVLNSIGSKFVHEGISWMNTIITNNRTLETTELEPNTIYYMEKIMRKYIFTNREKIKRDAKIKSRIINILSFMVTRGSVKGYLLREETV